MVILKTKINMGAPTNIEVRLETPPIKISSTILERNGFKKEEWTTNSWILVEGGIKADIGECDEGWFLRFKDINENWFCLLKTIKYVHELQQCFRLFGLRRNWNDWDIENGDDCDWLEKKD
jgi:hypothetical protein